LLELELTSEFLDTPLDCSTSCLDSRPVTGQLDMVVIGSRVKYRPLPRASSAGSVLGCPRTVRRYPNLDTIVFLQALCKAVLRSGDERIELCRNAPDFRVDIGRTLSGNLQDEVPGNSRRVCIAFNSDVDGSVVIVVDRRLALLDLGKLDSCAGLLLKCLDGIASFADYVGSCGCRDCDLDGLLLRTHVSIRR